MVIKIKRSAKPIVVHTSKKNLVIPIIKQQSPGKKQFQYCIFHFLNEYDTSMDTHVLQTIECYIKKKEITVLLLNEEYCKEKFYKKQKKTKECNTNTVVVL